MKIQVCVGSSCHLKGAPEIVNLLTEAIRQASLECEITLAGCFCMGKCNREGVTVQVDDTVYTHVNVNNFDEFFKKNVLYVLQSERK